MGKMTKIKKENPTVIFEKERHKMVSRKSVAGARLGMLILGWVLLQAH